MPKLIETSKRSKKRFNTHQDFLNQVIIDNITGCHEWVGRVNNIGYGTFGINRKLYFVHRYSYEYYKGQINGLNVCHSCDNKTCVNPEHLFLGTQSENIMDCAKKGRWHNPKRKISELDVIEIRKLHEIGVSLHEISSTYNMTSSNVYHIIKKRSWKHI